MTGICLNRVGLILSIVGVIIIFIWGPPQPTFEGPGVALEDGTPTGAGRTASDDRRDADQRRKRYSWRSRLGLVLVGVGFVLQFASTFFPN